MDGKKRFGLKESLITEIINLAKKYNVEKVILFGSRARGDFTERSDIDLAFKGGEAARFILDVNEETDTLLLFDILNLEEPVQDGLLDSIQNEGVVLYEKV